MKFCGIRIWISDTLISRFCGCQNFDDVAKFSWFFCTIGEENKFQYFYYFISKIYQVEYPVHRFWTRNQCMNVNLPLFSNRTKNDLSDWIRYSEHSKFTKFSVEKFIDPAWTFQFKVKLCKQYSVKPSAKNVILNLRSIAWLIRTKFLCFTKISFKYVLKLFHLIKILGPWNYKMTEHNFIFYCSSKSVILSLWKSQKCVSKVLRNFASSVWPYATFRYISINIFSLKLTILLTFSFASNAGYLRLFLILLWLLVFLLNSYEIVLVKNEFS